MPRHAFLDQLIRGEFFLLDGAMGTELERRGVNVPLPLWSADALRSAPDTVQKIHEDYIRAGADILTAATFRTTKRTMAKAGLKPDEAGRLTALAVSLAREARTAVAAGRDTGREIWIAGALAPLEDCYRPQAAPGQAEATPEHTAQARSLVEAGADILLIETMNTIAEACAAATAAASTGVPFLVSFICADPVSILSGESLADAARAVDAFVPAAILVNCTPPDIVGGCLDTLARSVQTPIGCYPNAGGTDFDTQEWELDTRESPEGLARLASGWIRSGALILGGCCGTGPEHIKALRAALPPVLIE